MDETGERTANAPTAVGAQLRAAREARGQSLEDIGKQTRIPVRLLVQIEDGRLEGCRPRPTAPASSNPMRAPSISIRSRWVAGIPHRARALGQQHAAQRLRAL